jgi:hypothetical protein
MSQSAREEIESTKKKDRSELKVNEHKYLVVGMVKV